MSNELDLFENFDSADTMSVFEQKSRGSDGLYRPNLKDVSDPSKGYIATLRFLPNLGKDGEILPSAYEKATHYINITDHPEWKGYIDSLDNFDGQKCPLSQTFWTLKNSDNVIDSEKAGQISRKVYYYSYVMVVEDAQHPELEGKIMIFQYGIKIKNKIQEEKDGLYGAPCNIFNLASGKDFKFVMKKVGGYNNYDSSKFMEVSPLKFKKEGKLITLPTETTEDGKVVIAKKAREGVKKLLLDRDVDLSNFEATPWDENTATKVKHILAYIRGEQTDAPMQDIPSSSSSNDSFFDDDSDDDDTVGKLEDVSDDDSILEEEDDDMSFFEELTK